MNQFSYSARLRRLAGLARLAVVGPGLVLALALACGQSGNAEPRDLVVPQPDALTPEQDPALGPLAEPHLPRPRPSFRR